MKKFMFLLVIVLTVFAGCSDDDSASTSFPRTIDGVTYDQVGSEIHVVRNTNVTPTGNLTVLAEVNRMPVTEISSAAFTHETGITSVTLPASITKIGDYAFASCTSLTSVNIPAGVTSIGDEAFGYSGITSVTIPEGITAIPYHAFYSCEQLETVVLPSTVTSIETEAFGLSPKLATINIPSGLTNLGSLVFQKNAFTGITLPAGITTIPQSTFNNCTNLATVTLLGDITDIGWSAFGNCTRLATLNMHTSTPPTLGGQDDEFTGVSGAALHVKTGAEGNFTAAPWDSGSGYFTSVTGDL